MDRVNDRLCLNIDRVVLAHEFTRYRSAVAVNTECRQSSGICMCISGSAEFRIRGKHSRKFMMQKGDIIFLPSGLSYSVLSVEDYRHYTVNFILNSEGSVCPEDLTVTHMLKAEPTSRYESMLSKLSHIWRSKEYGFEMQAKAEVYQLLCLFFGELHEGGLGRHPLYSSLLPAKKKIEADFCSDITISDLAALCNMSETGFRRAYKSVFSQTAMEYRDKLRLLKAEDLLATGYHTVSEVAELCGFLDVSYFCRFFRKHTGTSPGRYSID